MPGEPLDRDEVIFDKDGTSHQKSVGTTGGMGVGHLSINNYF
jgi:hypothetical protein